MSSSLAIACVTAVLKRILANGLAHSDITSGLNDALIVTTLPPDRIMTGENELTQLNLFLYQVSPSTRLRRSSLLRSRTQTDREQSGDIIKASVLDSQVDRTDEAPLDVDLYYVLSAYSARNFEIEVLLGGAIQLLNRHRHLNAIAIENALRSLSTDEDQRLAAALAGADQPNPVRQMTIEARFLDTEELSRLWSAFQARYRPSIVYKIETVLAEPREDPALTKAMNARHR